MKNQLIDEMQDLVLILEEIASIWITWKDKKSDYESWNKARLKANISIEKMKFIEAKISNWFPNFMEVKEQVKLKEGAKYELDNGTILDSKDMFLIYDFDIVINHVFDFCDLILENLDINETSSEFSEQLEMAHENVSNYTI